MEDTLGITILLFINNSVDPILKMKPTPKESKKIHENYKKVVGHLIEEKYAVDAEAADKIISGMSQEWFDTIVG